jgi:hypothetical protein
MPSFSKAHVLATLVISLLVTKAGAQDLSTPVAYLSHFNEKLRTVNQTYINYLSAVSHGKSARKVEKLREKTVNMIFNTRMDVSGTPPFKGDKALRDATVAYLKTCYIVFNEDYSKIVNMEEIAEQSYDAMEAYLLAQQKAGEKLEEAAKLRHEQMKMFAESHNITLVDKKDELDLKMEQSDKVTAYYNKVFLIFFKSNKQDAYLTQAINVLDINGVEQNKNALQNYANAGLEDIAAIGAFESDARLTMACKKALQFYKELTAERMAIVSNYILAGDAFKKLKKEFDAKPAAKRTQADVDAYNKAVAEMNKWGTAFNKSNDDVE